MKKYNNSVGDLFFLILCSILIGSISTTVLCSENEEKIPISSPMGLYVSEMAKNGVTSLEDDEIRTIFLKEDKRNPGETDPSYALLEMKMDTIYENAVLKHDVLYKGSGTVLYRFGDYILVLTACHNIHTFDYCKDGINICEDRATQVMLLEDNRDKKHPNSVLAEMEDGNWTQIGKKDIALVAMKLKNGNNLFKKDEVIHDILDFNNFRPPGRGHIVLAQINQYPAIFDSYVKLYGMIYHANGYGHHYIPTLGGASGSAVIIDNSIVGVHVRGGRAGLAGANIKYRNKNILNDNNNFELISLDEIKKEGIDLKTNNKKIVLADLIQKYINKINEKDNAVFWAKMLPTEMFGPEWR